MASWMVALMAVLVLSIPAVAAADEDANAVFQKNCSKCHGKEGKGDTKVGKKLKVQDYTDAAWQKKVTDEELTKAIKEGKGEKQEDGETAMPKFADTGRPAEPTVAGSESPAAKVTSMPWIVFATARW